MQIIYAGVKEQSLPSREARRYAEESGFHFALSKSHWCVQETLQEWVMQIVLPDYKAYCKAHGLDPETQVPPSSGHCSSCLLQLRCHLSSLYNQP